MTTESTKTLIQAYVSSKLDYCNSLLYGAPSYLLNRMQKVQNYAARVVNLVPKRDHITPVLASLHWLPVCQRVEYKIILYVSKCCNGLAPPYLASLLGLYVPRRDLRSAGRHLLEVPQA